MPGPLDGVRVVDLTTVMYGPYCTQIMGEMGADVIKVEPPGGDITRQVGPSRSPGMSAAHLIKGRNKRSLVLDLKQADAREALYRLAATADVFIHNMRPKAAESLGIGYEVIAGHRPDIVYCAATGFGEAGPYVDRPAYDDLIQGLSGLAALQGRLTGEPRYAPSVLADKTSGLFALYSIMMGLFHRERTGEGQRIHVPMYEAFTSFVMNEHMQLRVFDPPEGPAGYPRLLTKNRRPFPTRDGYVCLMPYTDRHWRRFFAIAGRPELADDPRFARMADRTRNIDTLYGLVVEILAERTTAEWTAAFDEADIPAAPMNEPDDLFEDPHLKAVDFFPVDEHPTEGKIRHIKVPVAFSKTPGGLARHAERTGESSATLLAELGYSEDDIARLVAAGATATAE